MSLIRWSADSALYIYGDKTCWECCGCLLDPKGDTVSIPFEPPKEGPVYRHILQHQAAGHRVPDWLVEDAKEALK